MFSNEEDDENQYAGLVARGRSSYAPQRGSRAATAAAAASPAPANAATATPTTVPALERRTSSTVSFPLRTSSSAFADSHEPFTDDPQQHVNITPLLLRKMQDILLVTSDASAANRVNRYQAALASRRMKLIATTLRQMPHPAPSPRLLTALQSLCLLTRQCAYDAAEDNDGTTNYIKNVNNECTDPAAAAAEALAQIRFGPDGDPLGAAQCWPVLLCHHFTARLLFRHAYQRLWAAWRMYSPTELEHEDAVAEARDREANTEALLRLLFAVPDSSTLETTLSPPTIAQHKKDMLAYYQRREMSPWRVFFTELEATDQFVSSAAASAASNERSRSSSPPEQAEDSVYRFRVLPRVYVYDGVPVVVKALCAAQFACTGVTKSTTAAAGASLTQPAYDDCDAATEAAAMAHAADFLQDVACRCVWCHPHVVGCMGAYTEKFVPAAATDAKESSGSTDKNNSDGDSKSVPTATGSGSASTATPEERRAPTSAVKDNSAAPQPPLPPPASSLSLRPAADLPWSPRIDAFSGAPVMALGYIMELQASAEANTPCLTLGDMLFTAPVPSAFASSPAPTAARHYFTLGEALDICAQVADALQYILEDSRDVPPAVRTAWLTLDPSNVYVVRTVTSAAGADAGSAGQLPPQRLQLSREASSITGGLGGGEAGQLSGVGSQSSSSAFEMPRNESHAGHHHLHDLPNDVVVPELAEREHTPLLEPAAQPTVHIDPAAQAFEAHNSNSGGGSPLIADTSVYVGGVPGRAGSAAATAPQRFVVRYCPPTGWTLDSNPSGHSKEEAGVGSRWRPHPRATAPASYAVAQLFLALLTRQVPYAAYRSDAEVQRRVFDVAAASSAEAAAAGVQVKPSSSGQGYSIPTSLPPALAQWCRQALSLDKSQPPMELESLRDTLTAIQASLAEAARGTPVPQDASWSFGNGSQNQEMSGRFDSAFA